MRPFWRHLFVYGVQAVYGCAIIYPANYLMGGNGVTENLLPHVLGCLYLLLAYGIFLNAILPDQLGMKVKSFNGKEKKYRK